MLEISSVSWQNFLSYGDYENHIDFNNLGQCLITGEIVDENVNDTVINDKFSSTALRRSNGSGKSNLPSVIQWVLFGRTMHSPNPGDSVINWYTGKNCYGRIDFKNGDYIIRTRNFDGKNELVYCKDGNEQKLASADTLSTAKNQQIQLNRIFKLDWNVFCGSVFFNQFGQPWMEMADQTRKKALERILRVDRFLYYAKVGKAKCDKLDHMVIDYNSILKRTENDLAKLLNDNVENCESRDHYISKNESRCNDIDLQIENEIKKRDAIVLPNLEKLEQKWKIVSQIEQLINQLRSQSNDLNNSISKYESDVSSLTDKIALWNKRSGKICVSCEQTILLDHVSNKIEPFKKQLTIIHEKLKDVLAAKNDIVLKIKATENILLSKKPSISLSQARMVHEEKQRYDREIVRLQKVKAAIKLEENPYVSIIEKIEKKIGICNLEIEKLKKDIERTELSNKHYNYIYKAYNDRTKIKSLVFQEHIPFINDRLDHYMDAFNLDVRIKLTDSLGISANLWGYDFESGGERKRTDMAFMFAIYDFHEHIYGRQCNILVLDEVDGRLDDDGINSLINVINNDLGPKIEAILVVSHRNLMFDVFPKEIKVIRKNRCSRLEII